MPWPTFFLTGPNKTASTSLFAYLHQHPQIYMPPVKEPSYFATYSYERDSWVGPPPRRPDITPARYQQLYEGVTGEIAIGDASTSSFSCAACHRIAGQIPQARLIAVLRQPIDRAYSRFLHNRRTGVEPLGDFATAYAASEERARANCYPGLSYYQPGHYLRVLQSFFDHFPRSQVRVYRFDELQQNAAAMIADLYGFVGVDVDFRPDLETRYNVGHLPRFGRLQQGRRQILRLAQWLPPSLQVWLRPKMTAQPQPLNPALRLALTCDYTDEIHQLEALLGWDLSSWLTHGPDPSKEDTA